MNHSTKDITMTPDTWAPQSGRDGMTRDGQRVTELTFDGEGVSAPRWVGRLNGLKVWWGVKGDYGRFGAPDYPLDLISEWPVAQHLCAVLRTLPASGDAGEVERLTQERDEARSNAGRFYDSMYAVEARCLKLKARAEAAEAELAALLSTSAQDDKS